MDGDNSPKISNIEWGIVIGALMVVDAIEIVLDIFAVGIAANRFIDIAVGFLFGVYLQMRGQSFRSTRRLVTFGLTFFLEMIPLVDFIPWWTIDGFYNRHLAKKRDKEGKGEGVVVRGGKNFVAKEEKKPGTRTAGVIKKKPRLAPPRLVDAIKAKT